MNRRPVLWAAWTKFLMVRPEPAEYVPKECDRHLEQLRLKLDDRMEWFCFSSNGLQIVLLEPWLDV